MKTINIDTEAKEGPKNIFNRIKLGAIKPSQEDFFLVREVTYCVRLGKTFRLGWVITILG